MVMDIPFSILAFYIISRDYNDNFTCLYDTDDISDDYNNNYINFLS